MNKQQRNTLQHAINVMSSLADVDVLNAITIDAFKQRVDMFEDTITEIAEQEREKFDNMPEGLQASPTGQRIEEIADLLEGISVDLDLEGVDKSEEGWAEDLAQQIQDLADEAEEAL